MLRKILNRSERGQAIVLIAAAMIALIAIIGLSLDGGTLFIQYGRLKRAIDAAAVSAALQYREGYTTTQLADAAAEFLKLNQIDVFAIQVDTCDTLPGDPELCTNPRRKLVRVTASISVDFSFLTIVGIDDTTLSASSVGEAASVDVVLVIDASASMAFETPDAGGAPDATPNGSDSTDDPSVCNVDNSCQPFHDIKEQARQFVEDALWFPYDRVAIVTFDRDPHLILPLTSDGNAVLEAIENLTIFEPDECTWGPPFPAGPTYGPCLNYDAGGSYIGLDCPRYRLGPDMTPGTEDDSTNDPSSCTSSNTGGALKMAGAEFFQPPIREDSLWVVVVLVGGPANTGLVDEPEGNGQEYPDRICPPTGTHWVQPWCRDDNPDSRHPSTSNQYDADDYARDMADYAADPETGSGAVIFSIGLGRLVREAPFPNDPAAGEELLQYAATEAGGTSTNHGLYFYSPTVAQLREIFLTIANNIATRLSR